MRLREQVDTGASGTCADSGASSSSAMEKCVQPIVGPGWTTAERQLAIARANQLLAAVSRNESNETLREMVLKLVLMARHAPHQTYCPIPILDGLSHESLKGLVAVMSRLALSFLFEEERKCRAAIAPGTEA